MKHLRLMAAALIAALPLTLAHADEKEEAATAVASTLVNEAHAALTFAGPEAEKHEMLETALEQAFDFDIWERYLIDKEQQKEFTPEQLDEFRALLPGFLANLYAQQFGKGLEAKPVIKGARPARNDVLVSADIPRANGKNLPVDWRVRDFGADKGDRVIDVMVGGTSFLRLKRDEFKALLDRDGSEGLLAYMRKNAV